MGWRDRFKQYGSFRGARFYTESHSYSSGRRQIVHEFPNREEGYVEDNGRRDGRHQFQLYVVGDDYDLDRAALEAALESDQGAGTLIHPRRGSMLVVVDEFSVTESTAEGGLARFDVSFIEAKRKPQPDTVVDSQATVQSAADQALQAVKADFAASFTVDGLPEFVSGSAQNRLQSLVSDLRGINGRLSAAQQPISDFFRDIDSLGNELGKLIRQPADLANRLVGGIGALSGVINDVSAAFSVYENLSNITAPSEPAFNTPSRHQEKKNLQAINQLQAQAVAVESARAASQVSYNSYQQAVAVRQRVMALIDQQLLTANDDTYLAMRELRAKVTQDIKARGADLSRVESYTPTTTAPALVVAYQRYGDYQREADILQRNSIDNPAFVQAGDELEVLNV